MRDLVVLVGSERPVDVTAADAARLGEDPM